ncbi:MAG TPA: DUF4350 domain-containing protein, partial [Phenylobacterium sp.]|nr:DUF4350 domain-containing protein [Phenylobacterium sp.]
MSEVRAAPPAAFSPRVMIALVLVGIFAFSGFTVLSVYAPELRSGDDGGAHALSKSAVGFAGAARMLQAEGVPVVVSRSPLHGAGRGTALRVLTPTGRFDADDLKPYERSAPLLIVLPKWAVAPDPVHRGWVRKVEMTAFDADARSVANAVSKSSVLDHKNKVEAAALRGAGGIFAEGTYLPLDRIEWLQTISGDGWRPQLVTEDGRMVLASWRDTRLMVLSDPDLLNTHGLKGLNNARAGLAILNALRGEDGVAFDVTLNGFQRPRSVLRLLFEPPMLGATLCAAAAALLMGIHAAVRFGPAVSGGRAFALGKRALIDTSADLIRAAHKEHELAPAYANLTEARAARAAGDREAGVGDR